MSDTQVTLQTVVCQNNDLVPADMGGEVILLSVDGGRYYCLNETSSSIWHSLCTPTPIAHVCSLLQQDFDVERGECEASVLRHVEELLRDKVVKVIDANAG